MAGFIVIIQTLVIARTEKIVEYRFSDNFGQVFHDYSGYNFNAVNGDNSLTSDGDTIPTDRGAYFRTDMNCLITLPPNDKIEAGLSLSNTFTITIWALSHDNEDNYIFYRKKYDGSNYFYIQRIKANKSIAYNIVTETFVQSNTSSQPSI
ncbi:hypothetical protein SteCoe_36570 [Stentor coeruleus]|uniref:Uncharacterized protein n=1 Tax=Stentor coeruleus TaxID=5963 RepID=A0A1R2AQ76_9CILI|nr:hypothetical protein SteCoe_36570 [Stentor coeruleus]